MAGLIQAELRIVQAGARQHSDGTGHHARLIGQNVSEHVLGQNHIKLRGILHQLHGAVVNQHVGKLHIRVVLCHLVHHRSPKAGGIQNIRLVHAGHLSSALARNVKGLHGDSADLIFIINQGVNRGAESVFHGGPSFAEIQPSGQLPHDQQVKSRFAGFLFQRTRVRQFLIQHCGAQIRKQPQLLADGKKPRLRTPVRRKLIPGRGVRVSPDGTHQNSITLLCRLDGLLCQRNAVYINGRAAQQNLRIGNLMSVFHRYGVQYLFRFSHNFRTDSIAGNASNVQFHILLLFCRRAAPLFFQKIPPVYGKAGRWTFSRPMPGIPPLRFVGKFLQQSFPR